MLEIMIEENSAKGNHSVVNKLKHREPIVKGSDVKRRLIKVVPKNPDSIIVEGYFIIDYIFDSGKYKFVGGETFNDKGTSYSLRYGRKYFKGTQEVS